MTVQELYDLLDMLPYDAEVKHLWDGKARTTIRHVWISKGGDVVTADDGKYCYEDSDRPISAPTVKEDMYWKTPCEEDQQ